MIIRKCFKYRLRPNRKQSSLFVQFAGACRWVYNRGLARKKQLWEESKSSISLFEQNKELATLKKAEATSWLKTIHSQILQQALGDLDLAYKAFFRRTKSGTEAPGYPRFRVKGDNDSFRYPQGVRVDDKKVYFPCIGWVRFRKSREVEGQIKQTTVIKEGKYWYVCFSCAIQVADFKPIEDPSVIGIDLGLESFAVIASEQGMQEWANARFLKRELKHLQFLCRQLSKKQKGSSNRQKAKIKLKAFHAKIRQRRKDLLHKLSTMIVKSHDRIVVESLKVKDLLQKAPRALARSISDAGWRQFLGYLKYKCEHYGKEFVEAGEWFASTKECHKCGMHNEMPLHKRTYVCSSCGLSISRDHNSALNLRAVGMTGLKKACGAAL